MVRCGTVAVALVVLAGCVGTRTTDLRDASARPIWMTAPGDGGRVCYRALRPYRFSFRCRDDTFGPPNGLGFRNRMILGDLADELREISGVERVTLSGYQSASGPEAGAPVSLSQARADSVARALAIEGYPAWRIATVAGGRFPGSVEQGDPCDNDAGHPHRRVEVEILRCVDQRHYERDQLGHSWLDE